MAGINYVVAFACAVGVFFFRNEKVMQLAQPPFLVLVLVGTVVDTSSIIFMSTDNRSSTEEQLDAFCIAWPWLLAIGQMMTTATLIAKMYRVKSLTVNTISQHGRVSRKAQVRPMDVSYFIIGGLVVDILLLGLWFGLEGFEWIIQVVSTDGDGFVLSARGECSSEGDNWWIFPIAIMIFHFGMLVYGNYLAYATRRFHQVSDSKWVAISLFNSIQLLLVVAVMLGLSDDNVSISYVVRASYAFLNNIGVLLLIVAPKVLTCLRGQGDILPDIHAAAQKQEPTTDPSSASRVRVSGVASSVPGVPSVEDSTVNSSSSKEMEAAMFLMLGKLQSMEEEQQAMIVASLCNTEEERNKILLLLESSGSGHAPLTQDEKRSGWGGSGFSMFSEHEDKQSEQQDKPEQAPIEERKPNGWGESGFSVFSEHEQQANQETHMASIVEEEGPHEEQFAEEDKLSDHMAAIGEEEEDSSSRPVDEPSG